MIKYKICKSSKEKFDLIFQNLYNSEVILSYRKNMIKEKKILISRGFFSISVHYDSLERAKIRIILN